MIPMTEKYQRIFSLRIRMALRERGIEPLYEEDNKLKRGYKCWVYENTSELQQQLASLMAPQGEVRA